MDFLFFVVFIFLCFSISRSLLLELCTRRSGPGLCLTVSRRRPDRGAHGVDGGGTPEWGWEQTTRREGGFSHGVQCRWRRIRE